MDVGGRSKQKSKPEFHTQGLFHNILESLKQLIIIHPMAWYMHMYRIILVMPCRHAMHTQACNISWYHNTVI